MLISWWLGPLARSQLRGVLRLAAVALLSAVAGTVLAAWLVGGTARELAAPAAVAGLGVLVAGLVTLALGALAGFAGIGLAALVFLGTATPLVTGTDPVLLSRPWQLMSGGTPPGTTLDALEAVALHEGTGLIRALAILGSWASIAVAVVALSRRDRGQEAGRRRWRLHVAAVVLPAAALAVVLVSMVGSDRVGEAATPASRATTTECVAAGPIESVADLNRVATQVRGGPEFQGADVGADVLLQDGRRLWLFGDTLRTEGRSGQRFVRNSMLLFDDACLHVVLPADGGALVPDRAGRAGAAAVGYWPMSVAVAHRPGYDLVAVMTQRVRTTGQGAFDFENLGPAVAVFLVPRGETPQLLGVEDLGPDSTEPARPVWGAAAAVADGWLYLYGTATTGEELVFGRSLHVARVRPEQVLEPSAWRYWDGRRWTREAADAAALIDAEGGTSQTLSVFGRDGRWFALSKRDDFVGHQLTLWSAPAPWGPFDEGRSVGELPSDAATGELRYMPLAHPDLLPRPGTVVVSYSRNRTDVGQVVDDPFLYRPRFLRVRLPE